MSDNKKIGVYLCSGCDIGKCLEMDKLSELAAGEENVSSCNQHEFLCNEEGVKLIQDNIKKEGLNKIVIAACSQRVNTDVFNFDPAIMLERVSLREHVVWSQKPNDEDTQMMAEDYLKMAIAKIDTGDLPEPFISDVDKTILVVGGGFTGLNAALNGAKAGYKVILVEKEKELGGWANKYSKVFPKKPPYLKAENSGIDELIKNVKKEKNITVHTSSTLEKTSGQPGQFQVSLSNGNGGIKLKAGAIVQATGWKPYEAEKISHLGFGQFKNVITNVMFEEAVSQDKIVRPSDGKPPASIVFVQCAGSRDPDHLPYCSGVCCRVSLKQALYAREKYPEVKIYLLYKDLRSPAQYELFYAEVQKDPNIFFTKGDVVGVKGGINDNLIVEADDTFLGEKIEIEANMVVLATGMVPTTLVEEADDNKTPADPQQNEGEKKAAESAEMGAKILNLTYRQGTDLPTLKYGFPDSHDICFPYETRRTGIYAAGCVRAPMDMATSGNDANGAMLKAIQAVESISLGRAVHPRSGDETYPEFFMQRCTQCKRCTEECPFGTLDEDDKGTPLENPNRCRRCGICLGSCPERIVSFKNYSIKNISQMIKSLEIPDELEEKPRVLAFMCENDAYPAMDMVGMKRLKYSPFIRIIPVRCLGSVNSVWIADIMSKGYDGVLMIGCHHGDNYQCHYIHGSELAKTRMENVKDQLKQLALEEERVEIHEIAMSDYHKLPQIINHFMEVIEDIGMNPFKGF